MMFLLVEHQGSVEYLEQGAYDLQAQMSRLQPRHANAKTNLRRDKDRDAEQPDRQVRERNCGSSAGEVVRRRGFMEYAVPMHLQNELPLCASISF